MTDMKIRAATALDADDLARLHQKNIYWGFLSSFPHRLLSVLYREFTSSDQSVVYLAERGGRPVGFVSGALDLKKFYVSFLFKHAHAIAPLVMRRMVNYSTLRRAVETLRYPYRRGTRGMPREELVAIVVDDGERGRGCASSLFEALKLWFSSRGCAAFRTSVGDGNERSRKFFERMGCIQSGTLQIHSGERSINYLCDLQCR